MISWRNVPRTRSSELRTSFAGRTCISPKESVPFVLGPDTLPLGEREHAPAVTQSQIAATLAARLGKDYRGSVPQAAKPLPDVVATQTSSAVE